MSTPDYSIWFGRAGQLRKLYDPTGGMLVTRDRDTSTFTNKMGGTRTTRALDGARLYQLNYGALGRDNFEYLNAFQQGHMGAGPFVLVDPGRRNMLTVNQSSVTSQTGDTRGFALSGTGTFSISSVASAAGFLPRSLLWTFTTSTPSSPTLYCNKPSNATGWYGFPVIARPYTFWCTALASGGSIDCQLRVQWFDVSGASLGINFSGTQTVGTTVPVKLVCTKTPPAGAAWAIPAVAPVGASIAAGESLTILDMMLQEGDAADARWKPGTGIYPVTVAGLPERYGFAEPGMLVSPTLTLQEVR